MKRTDLIKTLSFVLAAVLLSAVLGGCGGSGAGTETPEPSGPAATAEPAKPAEPAAAEMPEKPAGPGTSSGRQDGERFETLILLEGMEERVQYEHVRNEMLGIEMDYDYALFERHSEPDSECFFCVYDSPEQPENYLEVTRRAEDAETAAQSIGETLSNAYEISKETFMLDGAGKCIRIDASAEKGGLTMPDRLQTAYIIPAADGCRVAVAHYSIEGAEGFGRRFSYMVHTLSLMGGSSI